MSKKKIAKYKKRTYIVLGTIATCIMLPLVVGWIQSYYADRSADKKTINHLWNTLVESGEIRDAKVGPDSENAIALRKISEIEKSNHFDLWEKYVSGLEDNFAKFLNGVDVLVKINHRSSYDLVAMRDASNAYIAKTDTVKTYPSEVLPFELLVIARNKTNENDQGAKSLLPYILVSEWALQKKSTKSNSGLPVIDLSNAKVRSDLEKLSKATNSSAIKDLSTKADGVLVPVFGSDVNFRNCFTLDAGLVEIDGTSEKCRTLTKKYISVAAANANLSKIYGFQCESDLIRLSSSSIDIDPCLDDGIAVASSMCDRSIKAYIRKFNKNPNTKDSTHLNFLRTNCIEEIKKLKDPRHRKIFDSPMQNRK